jgi:hypothetical protein
VQGAGVPVPVAVPLASSSPSNNGLHIDKLQAVKQVVNKALVELLQLLDCIIPALGRATQQQLLSLVQIIKNVNTKL